MVQLSALLATNFTRIPPFAPDATNFCMLAYNVNQLQCHCARPEEHVSNIARVKRSAGGNSAAVVTVQVNNVVITGLGRQRHCQSAAVRPTKQ